VRKIIVIGASGLIGSHVVNLLSQADEVHALSRSKIESSSRNLIWHEVDLSGEVNYANLPQDADALIYLAQSDHFRDFPIKASEIFQINTAQVVKALDFSQKTAIKSFIYASSGGVYGFPEKGVSEGVTIPASGNLGFYLSTKLCSEILAENFAPFMNVVMLRFFFVYGAGQKRGMLIPRLIDNIQNGATITLDGENGIKINPIHVSDAAKALQASLSLKGCHRINIAGPDILSLREISNIIGQSLGKAPVFNEIASSVPGNLIADIACMQEILIPPIVRFDQGILDLIHI
jgi:nucleoside-diphosphate-sugar epimerase